MPKNALYIIIFLCAALHSGCMIYIPTPKIFQQKEIDYSGYYKDSCAYWEKVPIDIRLSKIPFKGADKVELVSFQEFRGGVRGVDKPVEGEVSVEKPKEIDHYNTFFERFTLSQNDIDTLSQIMHFTDTSIQIKPLPKRNSNGIDMYVRSPGQKTVAGCFMPHHALLFYGKNGEQYARWDFCFLCGNHEINGIYYTKYLSSFDCRGQEEALIQLFKRIGITKYFKK
jgi:hypothetical protein